MGNSFGKIYKISTFGESHGKAIGVIIDGCPPGVRSQKSEIQRLGQIMLMKHCFLKERKNHHFSEQNFENKNKDETRGKMMLSLNKYDS